METFLSSKKATSSSLKDIFKYDDTESLKYFIKANPEISISTYITFSGNILPVGAVAAAMHYRAIECLKLLPMTFETYGGKMGGPSAAHVACENQWEPGLRILMNARVPLNTFDGNSKSPLAYVAEHENITFFRLFLQYFEENKQVKDGLKNVALESEGSLDFLSYCVEIKKTVMIEACNYAAKKGFITDQEIRNAIIRWRAKYGDEPMPLFLNYFETSFNLQDECKIYNLFSPLVPTSKFAEINSPYSIPIYDAIDKINKLCDLANFKLPNLPENEFSFEKFNEFPLKLESDNIFTKYFSTYNILKKYFKDFFQQMKMIENSNYYLPNLGKFMIIQDVWKDFGTVLSHVAYTGMHYHFEYPLHPLIYTVLTLKDPHSIDRMKPDDIEQYFQVIKPNKIKGTSIIDARKKGFKLFLQRGQDFIKEYDESLNRSWITEVRGYKMIFVNIHKGFYKETQDERFSRFQEEIKKLDVTTMRIWFEGINYESPLNPNMQCDLADQIIFKPFLRENDGGIIRANQFIQMFKEWMKETDIKILINFLTALLGNKVLLPVESNFKTLFIISQPIKDQSSLPHPYIVVPTQEGAIPILNSKEEINDLAMRMLDDGNIEYVNSDELLNGLIYINLER